METTADAAQLLELRLRRLKQFQLLGQEALDHLSEVREYAVKLYGIMGAPDWLDHINNLPPDELRATYDKMFQTLIVWISAARALSYYISVDGNLVEAKTPEEKEMFNIAANFLSSHLAQLCTKGPESEFTYS